MNERIKRLRTQSRTAIPYLSLERAKSMTEYYQTGVSQKFSVPVARAQAFKYFLENKSICLKVQLEKGLNHSLLPG